MKFATLFFALACPLLAFAQDKESEKERLKRPAEIKISAPVERIRSIILAEYAQNNWQAEKETASTITFTTRGGLGAVMAYGRGSKLEDIITITNIDGVSLVLIDSGALAPRPGGHFERFNINSDKKSRKLTEALLLRVKEKAESGR